MKKEASVVYPHQLFEPSSHPALEAGRVIYLVEEALFLTEFPTHTQKLLFHRTSLQAYAAELESHGFTVVYLDVSTYPTTESVFARLRRDTIDTVHIVDTTDCWLEKRIAQATKSDSLTRINYESPLFILPKAEAVERYLQSKRHLINFYKQMRIDRSILVDSHMKPLGGKWSLDHENRKKIPKHLSLPEDIDQHEYSVDAALKTWLNELPTERYGEIRIWIPFTRKDAEQYLANFIENRLFQFGPYEDAIDTRGVRLWHSSLSPLMNSGLLSPSYVLKKILTFFERHSLPLNSLEGFVRQILGWREFIRAAYEADGTTMRTSNFFQHKKKLPESYWNATTGIYPIDHSIKNALRYGYTHHIERLMVLGNFMLLSHTHPREVYKWFMAMYIDAYDWVMVPNVYGMSQFADGDLLATKPYISGGNYLKKMSNYSSGDWEELYTALYWYFIETRKAFFMSNHRLSMMPKLLEGMDSKRREQLFNRARMYLRET